MFVFAKMLPLHCDIQTFIEYAVAPYVGAWIETSLLHIARWLRRSHPTWVRGLKPMTKDVISVAKGRTLRGCVDWNHWCPLSLHILWVAPYVGAWIETTGCCNWETSGQSHPTWVRGLKHHLWEWARWTVCRTLRGCVDWNMLFIIISTNSLSRTLRGCVDWNNFKIYICTKIKVAPYVGAWIETSKNKVTVIIQPSHPTWVRGLKHVRGCEHQTNGCVAPYVGAWIETGTNVGLPCGLLSRTLRGCVDWNW